MNADSRRSDFAKATTDKWKRRKMGRKWVGFAQIKASRRNWNIFLQD